MEPVQRLSAVTFARKLGDWRRAGRVAGGSDYTALAAAVRGLIRDGRLGLSVRLPAERVLADELGASRTTVSAAYRLLREQGYLRSRRGAGSDTALPEGHRMSTTGMWAPDDDVLLDLSCAAPPAPAELGAAARCAAEDLPRYASAHGYHPSGVPALRAAVADLYTRRGVPTSPAEILVTSGAQQAFDLALRLLVAPGERILVESPSYPNALAALGHARARVETLGVGPDGWDTEPVLRTLAAGRFRLGYLIPDFQNPTGLLMPYETRASLAAAAYAGGTTLVADETFTDIWLDGEPAPPMAAADRHRRVVTVGGMSKSYWGGLRVGWLRAAPALVQRLAAVRAAVDMGGAVLDQLVTLNLLAKADTILPARRAMLRAQRDALVAALREHLPEWRFAVPAGGISLWVELDAPVASALARAAEAYGVRLAPGPRFGAEGTFERFVRLPYARSADELTEAVRRIAAARADLDAVPTGRLVPPAVVA
ncbi:MocR-like transcription factor YczR [Actinocatenispora rupis]|uniref:GntR family transcriptional regulator n=1 Tax=Actinocatenispora rupis TaxID=519421 RepID=A0A8J3IV36_9ACTN|nr:PLP-dependent aminotransferase family protein [Actinocatenispora rupis]GID09323.1 GntR family transcriptional regulator [Actinocatenispora rupis]